MPETTNTTSHKIFGSGMAGDASISTQNMSFKDNSPGQMDSRGSVMDPTRNVAFMSDTTLNEFFSRPVKIFDTDWAVNSSLFARFNPWELFWENPRNAEKIRNYYLLKCTMHVKLLINGNAFYYGRAILGYEPLAALDNTSYTSIARKNAYENEDLVRLSQRMKVFVNPTESSGGSLELPFFWDRNALSIPDRQWRLMGDCVLMSLNDLKHANGGTDPLSISVLAWAENVSYSIPTSAVPEAGFPFPEAGGDEHETAVVSRPASTVARYAGALTNIPWIGPFARATEIGAGAVAAIAKIFGYSSPANLEYEMMVPNPRPSMAVVDTKYSTNKLSVDSKQEITIDPATTGITSSDELPIAAIAGRESFLTSFDWLQSDVRDASLFQCRVDPQMFRTNGSEYHLTACAAAVLPFDYWRGTMRFRFQIVSSNYHKGRIRIVYDPLGGSADPEYNTHYTTIHDISSEKDFTVDIGWAQQEAYRRPLGISPACFSTSRISYLTPIADKANGVLSVHVLNELTVPGTVVSDIQVNVFVSMLDDFEVGMPASELSKWRFRHPNPPSQTFAIPEAGTGDTTEEMDCCDDAIQDPPTIDTMADAIIDTPETTKLFFGEVIGSFRQLLKRTCLSEVVVVNDEATSSVLTIDRRAFPEYGGMLTNGDTAFGNSMVLQYSNGQKVVPTATTPINYLARMFLGWRGSVRWTFDTSTLNVTSGADQFNSISPVISRSDLSSRLTKVLPLRDPTSPLFNAGTTLLDQEDFMFLLGAFVGNTNVNPLTSVEVPFYSNRRFEYTHFDSSFGSFTEGPSYKFQAVLPGSAGDTDISFVRLFCSAGEDFNLFFFNGLPPIFNQPTLPLDPGSP
jgi:hypothetical protein